MENCNKEDISTYVFVIADDVYLRASRRF